MGKSKLISKEIPRAFGTVVLMLLLWWAMILFGGALTSRAQTTVTILSGPSVSSITETTAVVTWSTSAASTTVVHFGTTTDMGQVFRKIVPIEETEIMEISHSMTLWSLESGTTYYYKVRSVTAEGGTVESMQYSFTTASAIPDCTEDLWACGEWGECMSSGVQVRSCELESDCPLVDTPKPDEERMCDYVSPEEGAEEEEEPPQEEPSQEEPHQEEPEPEPEPVIASPTEPPPTEEPAVEEEEEPVVEEEEEEPIVEDEPVEEDIDDSAKEKAEERGRLFSAALKEKASEEQVSDSMKQECGSFGVPQEMCYEWASVKLSDKSCEEAGIMTAEGCEEYLAEQEDGVFPGCVGLTDAECETVKEKALAGYMSEEERVVAEEVLDEAVAADTMLAIPDFTPLREERTGGMRWRESAAEEGAETSSFVINLDTDGDGLPDQLEDIYGSDPNEADSDGDGTIDSEEVAAGDDPASEGELERDLTPTERALAEGRPIGQPRGAGEEDEEFVIGAIAPDGESDAEDGIVLSGTCERDSICLIYVYTYVPMVYVASTDDVGNFTVSLGDHIMDGDHTVYVALTDDTGKVTRKSSPLSLFVREAVAVTEDDFLNPFAIQEEALPMEEPVERYLRGYVVAALVLVLLAFLLMWLTLSKKREVGE